MVRALRSALRWGRRPVEFIAGVPGDWTDRDSLLAQALDEYEATRVGFGGIPKRITQDPAQDGEFEVDESIDYAKSAYDEWLAQERKRTVDPPPGRVPNIVWTGWRRDQKDGGQPGMEPHVIHTGEWPSAGQ